jgi:RHH-type proline utilization regulon transcriptional repressor/proline dehydrogenase/delta 1-pyrroline-5-carboxylate dehydrogenase
MATHLAPGAPLVAETGGLNAMIVDSTALPEQAVRAVIESAFQSAGQRCSALRCLYVQSNIYNDFKELLTGAMRKLKVGDPLYLSTDLGPVIDEEAARGIRAHVESARKAGRVLYEAPCPGGATFIAPTLIEVKGIGDLEREVFGPVLHIAPFRADALDRIVDDINGTGYGLTFGLQTRIDTRVQEIGERIAAGNIYVNRNQIGAIVGSQPFGGEGLSGTGPKAGGPLYLYRFCRAEADASASPQSLPGPTGELNRWSTAPRGPVWCLGPGAETAQAQAEVVRSLGGVAYLAADETPATLSGADQLAAALYWGDQTDTARAYDQALATREGPLVPLICRRPDPGYVLRERHLCVDTTAAGGNAALLGAMS